MSLLEPRQEAGNRLKSLYVESFCEKCKFEMLTDFCASEGSEFEEVS